MDEAELLKKLREAFSTEAQERLASLSSRLLSLEKGTVKEEKARDLEVAFREAHSLKGAARSVNLSPIETICQAVEGVFAGMKRDEIPMSGDLFDLLHQCVRVIEDFLAAPEAARPERMEGIASLVSRLKVVQSGGETRLSQVKPREMPGPIAGTEPPSHKAEEEGSKKGFTPEASLSSTGVAQEGRGSPRTPSGKESIRVSTAKLDALFLKAEEFVSLKLSSNQQLTDLKMIARSIEGWNRRWAELENDRRAFQKAARKDDAWDRLSRFLDWSRDAIQALGTDLRALTKGSEQNGRSLGLMVDDLLSDMKQVTMLPFSTLTDIFPRMVRDISREQGKDVDLVVKGGEVEIDRRILEEMRDPLTHILRNAIDHGLESPEIRNRGGKSRTGTIELTVSQVTGGKIEVHISDDGAGIDVVKVKKKARSLGILTEQELKQIEDRNALSLVLRSGVSTSPIITDISGRGLGLAIVQEKVEKLGGLLSLDTVPGRGTSFKMALPVTIATFRGILVRVAKSYFIVPSSGMERTLSVRKDQIQTVENRATIALDGKALALVDLAGVFNLKEENAPSDGNPPVTVAVLGTGERRIGFRIDEVLGEQEVLVKGLGKQLRHVPYISGATILGSGRVVPILNVTDLLTAPLNFRVQDPDLKSVEGETKRRSILVAEDSITSRMLLKSILEGAGYGVKTAVDGSEAFTTLKTGEFDLVISDIEMPRMNGFELTRKIRSDKKYADIPVILVTSLEAQEDREKGIDAGANAYIVKTSFDQSNLLEVVRRMI